MRMKKGPRFHRESPSMTGARQKARSYGFGAISLDNPAVSRIA